MDLLDEGFEPWAGVSHVYVMGSNQPTHAIDVTRTLPAGIDSLKAHATYIAGLGRDFDPEAFLRRMTSWAGSQLGVADAVAFGSRADQRRLTTVSSPLHGWAPCRSRRFKGD